MASSAEGARSSSSESLNNSVHAADGISSAAAADHALVRVAEAAQGAEALCEVMPRTRSSVDASGPRTGGHGMASGAILLQVRDA